MGSYWGGRRSRKDFREGRHDGDGGQGVLCGSELIAGQERKS